MSFPDLILAVRDQLYRRDRLVLFAFEPQSQRYTETESIRLLNADGSTELQVVQVVRTSEFIIVAAQPYPFTDKDKTCYLIRLDLTLAEINRIAFGSITALETDGENVFISAEGDFIVLSLDLTILNRAGLQVLGMIKKDAHGIVVHQKIAYVLDNVFVPVYIFKFDCSDPNNVKILEKHEFDGCQPHLDAQWIDTATQGWYVLVDNGNRFIAGQCLYFTEASSPIAEITFQIGREDTVYLGDRAGNQIVASTQRVPPWVVIKEGKAERPQIPERLYLTRVMCDREQVWIEPESGSYPLIDLYPLILKGDTDEAPYWDSEFNRIVIQEAGNYLFLIASRRNRLITKDEEFSAKIGELAISDQVNFEEVIILVIDTQEQPKILLNQRLEVDNQVIHSFANPIFEH